MKTEVILDAVEVVVVTDDISEMLMVEVSELYDLKAGISEGLK